jgi:hypothetical protein
MATSAFNNSVALVPEKFAQRVDGRITIFPQYILKNQLI